MLFTFYEALYREEGHFCPTLDGVQFAAISNGDVLWLDRPFEEEEIEQVVRCCEWNKAFGLDGSLSFISTVLASLSSSVPQLRNLTVYISMKFKCMPRKGEFTFPMFINLIKQGYHEG